MLLKEKEIQSKFLYIPDTILLFDEIELFFPSFPRKESSSSANIMKNSRTFGCQRK